MKSNVKSHTKNKKIKLRYLKTFQKKKTFIISQKE